MKRSACLSIIYVLCTLLCLTGCSTVGVNSDYREVDQLLVIRTVGIDLVDKGKICLSISADKGGTDPPVKMSATADTISGAEELLQEYAPDEQLFYPHVSYIVIGESAAKAGLGLIMDYIERAVEIRLNTPVFVVKGGSAEKLVLDSGTEKHSITEVLSSLTEGVNSVGNGHAYTASDFVSSIDESGGALLCCIHCQPENYSKPQAKDEELTALPAGYAVFDGYRLAGYVSIDDTRGVGLLCGNVGSGAVELDKASVTTEKGKAKITPVWGNSRITGINVSAEITGALVESGVTGGGDEKYVAALEKALANKYRAEISSALELSQELNVDFLSLGRTLELQDPVKYRAMDKSFLTQLAGLDFQVNATAKISRSYDLEVKND